MSWQPDYHLPKKKKFTEEDEKNGKKLDYRKRVDKDWVELEEKEWWLLEYRVC